MACTTSSHRCEVQTCNVSLAQKFHDSSFEVMHVVLRSEFTSRRQQPGHMPPVLQAPRCSCEQSKSHRFWVEVGGVQLIIHRWDKGCLRARQAGPVQPMEPGVQLDLTSAPASQECCTVSMQLPVSGSQHGVQPLHCPSVTLWRAAPGLLLQAHARQPQHEPASNAAADSWRHVQGSSGSPCASASQLRLSSLLTSQTEAAMGSSKPVWHWCPHMGLGAQILQYCNLAVAQHMVWVHRPDTQAAHLCPSGCSGAQASASKQAARLPTCASEGVQVHRLLQAGHPPVSQALPWVQCEEPVHQVLALLRDFAVLIWRPGEVAVQDVVKDLLQVQQEDGSSAEQAGCRPDCRAAQRSHGMQATATHKR